MDSCSNLKVQQKEWKHAWIRHSGIEKDRRTVQILTSSATKSSAAAWNCGDWTVGGKNQTREQKASICEEKPHLDWLRTHCWNELSGFLSLTVCLSLSQTHTHTHTHTYSWHAVFQRDLSASSGNSASSLQIQVPYKSLPLPLSRPPYLPFLPCFYTDKQAHAFPHACTPHFLHTRARTHKSGDDTSYWTAPHFLACTIYEAVDGQQHIVMCGARAAVIGWRPGSRGGEAEDACDWSELRPLKAEDFLYWMAAALGGAWVTLLGEKTCIRRVLCLYWSVNSCGWMLWKCVCHSWDTQTRWFWTEKRCLKWLIKY